MFDCPAEIKANFFAVAIRLIFFHTFILYHDFCQDFECFWVSIPFASNRDASS